MYTLSTDGGWRARGANSNLRSAQEKNNTNTSGLILSLSLQSKPRTWEYIHDLCLQAGSIYIGSTCKEDLQARIKAFEESGFQGDFYYAETQNMRQAEDELLKEKPRWNTQTQSIRKEKPGYVYLIKGRRFV